jgi:hypothetical protein
LLKSSSALVIIADPSAISLPIYNMSHKVSTPIARLSNIHNSRVQVKYPDILQSLRLYLGIRCVNIGLYKFSNLRGGFRTIGAGGWFGSGRKKPAHPHPRNQAQN